LAAVRGNASATLYEKYCLQEFFFPRYSEDWLKVFDGPDDDIKFVNPDDLDDITLGE